MPAGQSGACAQRGFGGKVGAFFASDRGLPTKEMYSALGVIVVPQVFDLMAILQKDPHLNDRSLCTILQILNVSLFEKKTILQVLVSPITKNSDVQSPN